MGERVSVKVSHVMTRSPSWSVLCTYISSPAALVPSRLTRQHLYRMDVFLVGFNTQYGCYMSYYMFQLGGCKLM